MSNVKKTIRGYVQEGMTASRILRFKKVPAYDGLRVLRPRLVTSKRLLGSEREIKITVELLDK